MMLTKTTITHRTARVILWMSVSACKAICQCKLTNTLHRLRCRTWGPGQIPFALLMARYSSFFSASRSSMRTGGLTGICTSGLFSCNNCLAAALVCLSGLDLGCTMEG